MYLTGSPSPLIVGETNSINNLSNTGIVTRPFDHRITKQLISGTPGPNAVVTYRLSIAVSGYVVPDITIVDAPTFAGTLVDRSSSNIIV